MPLAAGDAAPNFSLPDANGNEVSLSSLKDRRAVLFFYPRDNTPGCTREACAFRDAYADLQAKDVAVFGVSTDNAKSHTKFATKHNLPFPLLIDEAGEVGTLFGCYGPKKMYGKEYMGVTRSTFIIGPDGVLEKVYRKVKPEPHVAEVVSDIDALTAS